MQIADAPENTDYGVSLGSSTPRAVALGLRVSLQDAAESWGEGEASTPTAVTVEIGRQFAGEGHAPTLRLMYDRATLFALFGTLILALLALLMFCTAAAIVIYAPADRAALIPWVALPPAIVSFGLGGFAVFRLSITGAGLALDGNAHPSAMRPEQGRG